jgi:archaemetzincin
VKPPVIAIAPVGAAPPGSLEALVPEIAAAFAFRCDVTVVAGVELPARALDHRRGQYLATEILGVLERARRPEWECLLGVANVDLWADGFNFVFGEADPGAGVAVMSLARLGDPAGAAFSRRAAVEAIHEVGHTYGLAHCLDPRCVMWFSNTLGETDRKNARFCATHARQVARLK